MSACSCGGTHEAPTETEEVVEAEKSEALEEPVMESDIDKSEELYKDMEATLGKLKEIMAYLEEMKDEKMDHEEKEEEEKAEHEEKMEDEEKAEHEEEEEEEDEEEKMDHKKKDTIDELHKSLTTLKKYGINVYSGSRKTPAPKKIDTPAVDKKTDWFNFSKSLDEVAHMKGEETKI
tara:strand:- start:22 stop:552 length:531 start_codon:yes stop_codon:yes gene_type:complete